MPHPLSYALLLICLLFVHIAVAQCPAATPLTIVSVTSTESRCQASGTATVTVSGGRTPYTFSLIAGPTLAPPQSSNVLQSLAAGTYTVQVTDNCNTSVTRSVTVAGTYAVPSLAATPQSPSCPGGSNGSIQLAVTGGRAPLQYSLISPSPVLAGPQAGSTFSGLAAGTYTCRASDSCGNFQTRTVVLLDGSAGTVSVNTGSLQYAACDSFYLPYLLYITTAAANYKPPYTISLRLPNGTVISQVLSSPAPDFGGYVADTIRFRYKHVSGTFENLALTAVNVCGASDTRYYSLNLDLDMQAVTSSPGGCSNQYAYRLDAQDNAGSASRVHCGTITYTLVSPAGTVLTMQTNNSFFSGYPPGSGYKVVRQDCCKKDTLVFDWASRPAMKISNYTLYPSVVCKEGTTNLEMYFNISTQGNIILASGPASVRFLNGTVHTYIYPDTLKNISFNPYGVDLSYLATGTYKLYAIDTCGQKDSLSFTVGASNVRRTTFTPTLVKGCTNASKIQFGVSTNTTPSGVYPDGVIDVNGGQNKSVTVSPYTDSAVNLSSGAYYVHYTYNHRWGVNYLRGMDAYGCDVITDTITVPVYTQPVFSSSAAVAICGATRQVALLPDTASGIAPYQYQVVSGAVTTAAQASPVFPGLPSGTYTFLMADACANSYSRSMTVDTLAVPNVVTTGNTCSGGAATFTLPASPFYSYVWQKPGGGTSTGNNLAINPVTASDMGTYRISVTSSIGGCSNTTTKTASLAFCLALPATVLDFAGQRREGGITLGWHTADENNTCCYTVERSADGMQFMPLQKTFATGYAWNEYGITDARAPLGMLYYRLQVMDKSGKYWYSKTIVVNNGGLLKPDVFPRLARGNANLTVTYPRTTGPATVQVVGVEGRLWLVKAAGMGTDRLLLNISSLARGTYWVLFTDGAGTTPMQVWKE